MANELKIRVVFDTGDATSKIASAGKSVTEFAEGSIGKLKQELAEAKKELLGLAASSAEAFHKSVQITSLEKELKSQLNAATENEKWYKKWSAERQAQEKLVQQELIKSQEEFDKAILSESQLRAKQEALLQKHLGNMEAATAKEIALQAEVFAQRQQLAQQGANLSQQELAQQAKDMAALQAHLGKMEASESKQAQLDADKYSRRAKLIQQAERQSAVEIDAYQKLPGVMQQVSGSSANAAMTLQALNYTIRDAPYFARDFSLGLLAVGNNLNPLIDGFIRMKAEAGATGGVWKALTGMLTGPQGAIFAFSVIVSVIQAVTFALAKNKSEAEAQEKSLSELADELKTLEERYRDAKDEMLNIPSEDVAASFRVISKSVVDLTEQLKELIKQEEYYNTLSKSADTGQEEGLLSGAMAAKKSKELKSQKDILDQQLKVEKEKEQALLRQDKALMEIKNAYFSGDKKGVASIFSALSTDEQKAISEFIKKNGSTLDATTKKSFQLATEWIELTKARATELANIFDEVNKKAKEPRTQSADKNDWEQMLKLTEKYYEDIEDRQNKINEAIDKLFVKESELPTVIKDRLSLYKQSQDILDLISLQQEKMIGDEEELLKLEQQKLKVRIFTLKEGQRLTESISNTATEELMKGQMDKERKKDTTKVELENAKDVTQDISEYMKEIEDKQREINATANDVGNSLFNAFIQGKKGLDEFLESLGLAIAKMLFIKAITSLLGIASGGVATPALSAVGAAGGIGVGIDSKVASNIPQISTGGVSFNTNNKQIVQRLDALNANLAMLQPNVTVVSNVPGLEFTKQVTNKAQAKLSRGNVKNVV